MIKGSVLVTGGDGFIGRYFVEFLRVKNVEHKVSVRNILQSHPGNYIATGDIDSQTCWNDSLKGVSTIVHLANRAHVLNDYRQNSSFFYKRTNVFGTINLAESAIRSGVKRFIYLSSIGVNGVSGTTPFFSYDEPNPQSHYAESKLAAENALFKIGKDSGLEIVIIRPPLVYHFDSPGNFRRLLRLVKSGYPLPFALINNSRSFVSLHNLLDFLFLCTKHPAAASQIFLVSDGENISTPDLIRCLASGMGISCNLFSVPVNLLNQLFIISGQKHLYSQLCQSLQIDINHTTQTLGWVPKFPLTSGLIDTANRFIKQNSF